VFYYCVPTCLCDPLKANSYQRKPFGVSQFCNTTLSAPENARRRRNTLQRKQAACGDLWPTATVAAQPVPPATTLHVPADNTACQCGARIEPAVVNPAANRAVALAQPDIAKGCAYGEHT